MNNEWSLETKAVQCGWEPKNGEPRVLPIYQSTTYKYDNAEQVAKLFDLEADGYFYSRLGNPTVGGFERKMAALEGGIGALATSAGQAASMVAITNICTAGQHFIAASALYGGTVTLFTHTLKQMGVAVTLVDPDAPLDELRRAVRPNTRAVFGETISNPGMCVLDFDKFAQLAHENQLPFIVDNTFATPYLCRPFEHGADIVVHSSTKYIDGHATSVGGIIIDSGKFDWGNGKFPGLNEPDESYHGLVYTAAFGAAAYIAKARAQWIRDTGCCMSPMNAFLSHLGLETLHVRMERHCANAQAVAEYLERHPKVAWVNYPGLKSNKYYDRARKYLSGCSGVMTFGVKGGRAAGETVMNSLKLAAIVVHVADVRTSVLHPASMTHRQLSDEEQLAAGVTPDLIRLSVGIENVKDIIADLDQALALV
ncbi:MAG: O-acetylhomoserine aminocarboxypropyltransferase/cysteine synthase [Victivallales bacterium]|nr:O-acetylhomoserine aminocarboxypropyltransferase/cysteine synthase [Victivallales bacterium]